MNPMRTLRNGLAFALGFFLALAWGFSYAAISVIPDVPGLTPASAGYTPSLGQLQGTQPWSSGSYSTTGSVNVGGKPLSIPAKVPLSTSAGNLVKNALKLNPTKIAATLAAGWLLEQGLEWLEGQGWTKGEQYADKQFKGYFNECNAGPYDGYYAHSAFVACLNAVQPAYTWTVVVRFDNVPIVYRNGKDYGSAQWRYGATARVPATDSDWDALPDPSSVVAPELPAAPYMPSGAPVDPPQFTSGNYPMGSPYKAPDGSTVQPMASVTNNSVTNNTYNNGVTISTYNLTTHDPDGVPVPAPTPEPTNETPDFCELHPDSLSCMDVGELPEAEALPRTTVDVAFTPLSMPVNMTCPAPEVLTLAGHTIPVAYDAVCFYAESLRPFVLVVAMLAGAYIIFGVRRGGEE